MMPIVAGAISVFDLGYYHFHWWQAMRANGCRFVTRLKTKTKITVTRERLVEPGLPILSDRIRTFIGTSENTIRTEIFIALIVLLLIRKAHASQSGVVSPLTFIRLERSHLLSRRDMAALRTPRRPRPQVPDRADRRAVP